MAKKYRRLYALRNRITRSRQIQRRAKTIFLVGRLGRGGNARFGDCYVVSDLVPLDYPNDRVLAARSHIHRLCCRSHLSHLHVHGRDARHARRSDARDSDEGLGAVASPAVVSRSHRRRKVIACRRNIPGSDASNALTILRKACRTCETSWLFTGKFCNGSVTSLTSSQPAPLIGV